jgi:hypothetical protein
VVEHTLVREVPTLRASASQEVLFDSEQPRDDMAGPRRCLRVLGFPGALSRNERPHVPEAGQIR